MATVQRIPASELRAGDWIPDADGNRAFQIEEIRPATNAEVRLFAAADGMRRGDIVAVVRWVDGGTSNRFWPGDAREVAHMTSVIRD